MQESILDANSSVPLYEQIKMDLLRKINTKELLPGERMPSEAEIGQLYGVSRITVRRTIQDMVDEGYLDRRQGKGCFVLHKRLQVVATTLMGLSGFQSKANGHKTSSHVLSKEERPATEKECEWLQLEPGENVWVFHRLLSVEDSPWMVDHAVYSKRRFPGFLEKVHDNMSTYEMLRRDYGVFNKRAYKEITLEFAIEEESKLLMCPCGAPLYHFFKLVYDTQGVPVHYSNYNLVADRVILTMESENAE